MPRSALSKTAIEPAAVLAPPTPAVAPHVRSAMLSDLVALTKPRVVLMVLATTLVGFYLGSAAPPDYWLLARALIGTGLAAGGTLALNQYIERDLDALMERTRDRPLPSGRLSPLVALAFGMLITVVGLGVLTVSVNPLSGLVTAVTVVTYLFGYTPLKRYSPLCSLVGAVPGALPPVTGWVAARGELGSGAWVLFAILFLWQLPHSLAIAKLYAIDYARAGFRLLPIVDRSGHSTERQIVGNCAALLVVGIMPTLLGLTGPFYFVAALLLGCGFFACGVKLALTGSTAAARLVLFASLLYLPLLLAAMAVDKLPS
jgi:protoheme IX farnesyltransferase